MGWETVDHRLKAPHDLAHLLPRPGSAPVALGVSIADPGPDLRSWPWLAFGAASVVTAVALFHVLHGAARRYLPTPRLTLPAPVATLTGHPAALLDMAGRWSEWRFPLMLGVATGGVYLLAVGLLEVKPYWVVFALAATLRPGVAAVRSSARDTVAGTVAGAVLATALVHLVPGTWPLVLALLALTTAGLLVSLAEPRLVRVLVTPVVVIAAGLAAGDGSLSPDAFATLRVLDFAAGAAIALALAWLVGRPWVRTQPGRPGAETGGLT